ncbi:TraB/GumN family protein [Massilia endophytica]|uniref:TraB/GumN family protein n=1 Tax=Massilia endophytica TaxID=2899220 RepID=UPI001E2F6C0B|nr:TraB/GumN family protein [Massilia endophytica]UGQ47436.1 TraB/GumN family protein [Massilia endophytica]
MEMNVPHAVASASASSQPIQLKPVPRRGALYRVRHDGKTSYLFGTIHVGKQNFFPLEPEVTRALADASSLVLELDTRAYEPFQQALAKYGSYPAGQTISQHLSPMALARLNKALAKAGMTLSSVEQYRPWLVANILVGTEIEKNGYHRSNGVEGFLLSAAVKQKKKVRELESADYQLSLFASLDDGQQERYLLENIAELDNGMALKKSAGLIDAWSNADAERIAALTRELTTGDTVSAMFMDRTLLRKRNPEMAANIEAIMKNEKVAFVGIGLLHLVGENGVPELLRQRGYEVEKMY